MKILISFKNIIITLGISLVLSSISGLGTIHLVNFIADLFVDKGRSLYAFEVKDFIYKYDFIKTVIFCIILLLACTLYIKFRKYKLSEIISLDKLNLKDSMLIIILAASLCIFFDCLLIYSKDIRLYQKLGFISNGIAPHVNYAIDIFSTCVFVSITEELLFRGILQGELVKKGINLRLAVLIQAIFFALFHEEVLFLFIVGFVFAFVYLKYNSLYASILMHAAYLFTSITVTYFVPHSLFEQTGLYALVISGVIVCICAYYMVKQWKKKFEQSKTLNSTCDSPIS